MRVGAKGQVTIPIAMRKALGLLPDTEVEFVLEGNHVQIRKARKRGGSRGDRLVEKLRGRATTRLTTEEILALTRGR